MTGAATKSAFLHLTISFWDKNMLKIQPWQLKAIPLTLGMALLSILTETASAQAVLDRGMTSSLTSTYKYSGVVAQLAYPSYVNQPTEAAPYIYGSPISPPMPVNPSTGLMPSNTSNSSNNDRNSYPVPYYSGRGRVNNSTLINPTLVNPRINDSTLINPTIINDSGYYGVPVRRERSLIIVEPR